MNADELKKADEIVRALRCTSDANPEHRHGKLCNQAADLIDSLTAQLADSQRREKAAVEQAILWGTSLIEANTDAHVTFCAECGFPIADYGVDKEIFCSMCKSKNPSHNYVVTGPGSCKTTAIRKAKTYDRLFGHGPQEAGEGKAE